MKRLANWAKDNAIWGMTFILLWIAFLPLSAFIWRWLVTGNISLW